MKKLTTFLLLVFIFFSIDVHAQLLRIDDQAMAFKGDTVEIPVLISNAQNVSSFQGSFFYKRSDLIFLEAVSNEFPITTNVIDDEKVVYIGGDFDGKTYTTEVVFITLKFKVKTTANTGFSAIEITKDPIPINFFDDLFNPINGFSFENGGVHIQGLLSNTNKMDFKVELKNKQLLISGYLPIEMRSNPFIELATQTGIFSKRIPLFLKDSSYFEVKIAYEEEFKYIRISNQEYISETKEIPNLELEEDVFLVYPNPFTEQLFYNCSNENKESNIYLCDSKGSLVFSQDLNLHNGVINLINLPKGMYFLHYVTQNKTFTKKIIKL